VGRRAWALLLVISACASCSGGHTAAIVPTASVTATTLSAVEREVEAAYLKSWDVYADAALHLTTAHLDETYAGDQLARTATDIKDRIATRRTAIFRVDHSYAITLLAPDRAEVRDRYVNHSVLVDPDTLKPTEADPKEVIEDLFTLEKRVDTWKVVSVRSA
jgi:hypothetical protein